MPVAPFEVVASFLKKRSTIFSRLMVGNPMPVEKQRKFDDEMDGSHYQS